MLNPRIYLIFYVAIVTVVYVPLIVASCSYCLCWVVNKVFGRWKWSNKALHQLKLIAIESADELSDNELDCIVAKCVDEQPKTVV